jgi:hypothetical protein
VNNGTPNQSQSSAAAALVQLLTENPGLPVINWSVNGAGKLRGSVFNPDADMRAMVGRYAAALGGTPEEGGYDDNGRAMASVRLTVSWRDVTIDVEGFCLAEALGQVVSSPEHDYAAGQAAIRHPSHARTRRYLAVRPLPEQRQAS